MGYETLKRGRPFGDYSRFRVDLARDRFGSLCAVGLDAQCCEDDGLAAVVCLKVAGIGGVSADIDAAGLETLARDWLTAHA